MSKELTILSAFCQDRELFESYSPYMEGIKNLERELKTILFLIKEYYKEFGQVNSISRDELLQYFDVIYPSSRDRNMYHDLIRQVFLLQVQKDLVTKILEEVLERHVSSVIVSKLIPVVEGHESNKLIEVYRDVESYLKKLKNPPKQLGRLKPCELSIKDLIASEVEYEGLNWHLPSLDPLIGRAKRKTLGLVYAFVDSGKSSFCLSACANFATQLKENECIVYAGNEEAAPGMCLRLTQALLGKSISQILENPDICEKEREEKGFKKIKLYDSVTQLDDIESLLEEHHPRVLFIDQAVKVEGDQSDQAMRAIQRLFNTYRELGKQYETSIIGVAQGKGECEDKKYLNLSDIYNSRVAIQGELDWALGIGRLLDPAYEKQRFINIPKSKLGDNAKFVVLFDKHLCKWEEV